MTEVTVDDFVAALVVLAEAGIPSDIQELLVRGDPSRSIKPNALFDCLESLRSRAEKAEAERDRLANVVEDFGLNIDYAQDYVFKLVSHNAYLQATCEKLAKALEPFADEADRIHPDWEDERRRGYLSPSQELTVGDFRKAREVLAAGREVRS